MVNAMPTPPVLPRNRNGLGTAGFVLGLLAALFSLLPLIGVIAWPMSILGLIFGIIGISQVRQGRADNKGMAITGTVLSAIGLVICIAWTIAFGATANQLAAQSPLTTTGVGGQALALDHTFGDTQFWPDGQTVQVSQPREHHEDNPYLLAPGDRAVEVDLTITNKTDSEINPLSWNITAVHSGRPAHPILGDDALTNAQVPAGGSITLTRAFKVSPESGELQLSVQPDFFAQKTAYFRGQF